MIDSRTVRDTELDKVLDMIRRSALSPEGRDAITPSLVTSESAVIEKRAARIEAYMNLLSGTAPDPFPPISDLFSYVSSTHADIPGEAVWRAGSFLRSYVAMLGDETLRETLALCSYLITLPEKRHKARMILEDIAILIYR